MARGIVSLSYPKDSSRHIIVCGKKTIRNQGGKPMQRLNKVIVWVIVLFLQQQSLVQVFAAQAERIDAKKLKRLLDAKEKVTLVDVRGQIHFNFGHIPGAVSMPFPDGIETRHQTLPAEGLIVLY